MSSLSSYSQNGKTHWRVSFRQGGKQRTLRLGAVKKTQATTVKTKIDDLIRSCRLNIDPNIATQQWIQTADWPLVERLEAMGLTDRIGDLIQQRRIDENPELADDEPTQLRLLDFFRWYIRQRKAKCEESTIQKITSSLNQLANYCRDHESIELVTDIDASVAFRFQQYRLQTKAEATVSKDVKIAKTAFSYAVQAGKVPQDPFKGLKPGSDVNLDGQHIIPISDYDKLIDACPNSDWRTIIALARLGGLRCPSELANLKWTDVNWDGGTLRITSPKTKRYGKPERTIPLFGRLENALSDHWELTAETSEFVIVNENLRRRGASLSTRFHKIRVSAGVPIFDNPFRNMRLSAANDVSRLPGITPKNMMDWFGHDMKTALKHYHRTTRQDFDQALAVDPFRDSEIARTPRQSDIKSDNTSGNDNASDNSLSEIGEAHQRKTPAFSEHRGMIEQKVTPTGLEPVLPP